MTSYSKKRWRAVVNLAFPDGTRVQAGQLVPKEIEVPDWMIEQGKVSNG